MIELRPYQQTAVNRVLEAFARGVRRQLVVMPTGAGKTVLFSALPHALFGQPPYRTLILAHRDELVGQAASKFARSNPGVSIGIEKGKDRARSDDDVVCASVQTLTPSRLVEFYDRWGIPKLIITDEAHHAIAPGYQHIYEFFGWNVLLHVGVTATPARGDRVGLNTVFDELVYSLSLEECIALKALVPVRGFRVVTSTNLKGLTRSGGDFNQKQLAATVNNDERNGEVVRAYLDLAAGRKAIAFAVNIAHSQALVEVFAAAGVRARHIDGKIDLEERRGILEAYARGDFEVLCNCAVLTEGFDEPSIECVIMARPTMSAALFTQCTGRGTRLSEATGKTDLLVIDMHDLSRSRSCFSLPALFGMPPNFDLQGRDALATAKRARSLMESLPAAEDVIESVHDLEILERVSPSERLQRLINAVRLAKNQRYVSVELLRPRPVPAGVAASAVLSWHALDETRFVLQLDGERLVVCDNLLGQWDVILEPKNLLPMRLGTFRNVSGGISCAERWARIHHGGETALLEANREWRMRPVTGAQKGALKRHGLKVPKDMQLPRGEASLLISALKNGQSPHG